MAKAAAAKRDNGQSDNEGEGSSRLMTYMAPAATVCVLLLFCASRTIVFGRRDTHAHAETTNIQIIASSGSGAGQGTICLCGRLNCFSLSSSHEPSSHRPIVASHQPVVGIGLKADRKWKRFMLHEQAKAKSSAGAHSDSVWRPRQQMTGGAALLCVPLLSSAAVVVARLAGWPAG